MKVKDNVIPVIEEIYDDLNVALLNTKKQLAEMIAAADRLVVALDEISIADESGEMATMNHDEIVAMYVERDAAHDALRAAIAKARGENK